MKSIDDASDSARVQMTEAGMATVVGDDWSEGGVDEELLRLRKENRRLAVTVGAFSAFLASRELLEEAWQYVHNVHQINDERE